MIEGFFLNVHFYWTNMPNTTIKQVNLCFLAGSRCCPCHHCVASHTASAMGAGKQAEEGDLWHCWELKLGGFFHNSVSWKTDGAPWVVRRNGAQWGTHTHLSALRRCSRGLCWPVKGKGNQITPKYAPVFSYKKSLVLFSFLIEPH